MSQHVNTGGGWRHTLLGSEDLTASNKAAAYSMPLEVVIRELAVVEGLRVRRRQ